MQVQACSVQGGSVTTQKHWVAAEELLPFEHEIFAIPRERLFRPLLYKQ